MHPSVSVILPVYNEIETIDACLDSLTSQDYGGPMEIIVADGGSTDGTLERLASWQERRSALRVVHNPDRLQSAGLNLAAEQANGDILVRADAHTLYARDYVRKSVEALSNSKRLAVGGPMRPRGRTPFGRAVAAAFSSPVAVGPARFHHGSEGRTTVDTVYLGAFRRDDMLALGGFRSFPSGVAEDADFYFRWRRSGGRVLLDPTIRTTYFPRETVGDLARQFFRYGGGKAEMLWSNGSLPSPRPLAPLALLLGLAGSAITAVLFGWWQLPVAIVLAWLAVLGLAARGTGRLAPLVMLATAVMHVGFGVGMLWGLVRGPKAVRSAVSDRN